MSLDQRDQPAGACQPKSTLRQGGREGRQGELALEVASQGQGQSHAIAIQLTLNASPCSNEDDGLGRVATRCLQDTVYILARVRLACRVIGVVLATDLDPLPLEYRLKPIVDPRRQFQRPMPRPAVLETYA